MKLLVIKGSVKLVIEISASFRARGIAVSDLLSETKGLQRGDLSAVIAMLMSKHLVHKDTRDWLNQMRNEQFTNSKFHFEI